MHQFRITTFLPRSNRRSFRTYRPSWQRCTYATTQLLGNSVLSDSRNPVLYIVTLRIHVFRDVTLCGRVNLRNVVVTNPTARYHIPEESSRREHRCGNLKSDIVTFFGTDRH